MSDIKHVVLIHGMCGCGDYLAPARAAFEERGYTVHSPTLRHHELPLEEGATKIASLSLRDYADDLVNLVDSLDSAALLVGHSMGGLLAQLVAGRSRHAGVIAACPSPAAGIHATSPTLLRVGLGHFLQPRPWAKPVYPMTWEQFRKSTANAQTEEHARELFAGLVCDSGRVMCEVGFPWLDRANAATVNYSAITTPVLVLAGEKPRADHRLASQLPGTTAPRLTPSPVHSTGRSAPIRGATLDRAQATANAPSTPAAVLIALGDGGQAESSGPRNECQVRWLCDLRRHCRHPKALWRCSCCRPLGPDLLGAEQRSEAREHQRWSMCGYTSDRPISRAN